MDPHGPPCMCMVAGGPGGTDGRWEIDGWRLEIYPRMVSWSLERDDMDLSWRFSLKMCIYWFRGDMMGGT